jgi:hypothetical protein
MAKHKLNILMIKDYFNLENLDDYVKPLVRKYNKKRTIASVAKTFGVNEVSTRKLF